LHLQGTKNFLCGHRDLRVGNVCLLA
jgi:hypothetical protein